MKKHHQISQTIHGTTKIREKPKNRHVLHTIATQPRQNHTSRPSRQHSTRACKYPNINTKYPNITILCNDRRNSSQGHRLANSFPFLTSRVGGAFAQTRVQICASRVPLLMIVIDFFRFVIMCRSVWKKSAVFVGRFEMGGCVRCTWWLFEYY